MEHPSLQTPVKPNLQLEETESKITEVSNIISEELSQLDKIQTEIENLVSKLSRVSEYRKKQEKVLEMLQEYLQKVLGS